MRDITERAVARAEITHDHEGGRAVRETFAQVGHEASSQTVCRRCSRSSVLSWITLGSVGARARIQCGLRNIEFSGMDSDPGQGWSA